MAFSPGMGQRRWGDDEEDWIDPEDPDETDMDPEDADDLDPDNQADGSVAGPMRMSWWILIGVVLAIVGLLPWLI